MSSQGAARKAKSACNFFPVRPEGDENRANKRTRSDLENNDTTSPTITVTSSRENLHATESTITVIEGPAMRTLDVHDVTKLERLVDKTDRYESHKSFLEQCIKDKIIPVGLQINLTPTIGNNDDQFVEKWHKRLEEFSLTLITDIIAYSESIEKSTHEKIQKEMDELKAEMDEVRRAQKQVLFFLSTVH